MSPYRESDPSRDDRGLAKNVVESESDTRGLTPGGGQLWLPVPRLVIPVAMPPLAAYVWREGGSLSEIGHRLRQWVAACNNNFFLSTLNRFGGLPGWWPLLDLAWFRRPRRRRDSLQTEPAIEAELPFTAASHSRGVDETRPVPPGVALAAEAELVDEVAEDYPLVIRSLIPRAAAGRRPPYAVNPSLHHVASPSLYPTYPALAYLPVVSEEVEPGNEGKVVSSTMPFISRPGILPIHQLRPAQEPHHQPVGYPEETIFRTDWRTEPIRSRQPAESIWPPFIPLLRPHRLPVVRPFPVIHPRSPPFIESVITQPERYLTPGVVVVKGQAVHPLILPYLARQVEKVLPFEGPFKMEAQAARPRLLPYINPRTETVPLPDMAQPTSERENYSAEAGSRPLSSPYQALPTVIKTIAMRPERPLVSQTAGNLKEPEFRLLTSERLIPDGVTELPANRVVPASPGKVEPSPLSMPLVSPLIPAVAEAPAVENVAGYPATSVPAQSPASPPAAASVEFSEHYRPEAGKRLLPFEEQFSLTGFRPEAVPLIERIDQTSAARPRLGFGQVGRASVPGGTAEEYSPQHQRDVPSPARIEEVRQPVSRPPVSPYTESGAEFTATYRTGRLSMFESQAAHESLPAPELALAPVGRRAESAAAPSSPAEARAEEHTPETPAPDLEDIANDVYRILKRRLARERERAFGVS